jgi:hypothetical protein
MIIELILDVWAALDRRYLRNLSILLAIVIVVASLAGCTYVAIEGPEYQATILTFTPTGNSTQFEGVLTGKGRVSLNRELGGAEGLVEAVNPGLLQ